MGRVGGRESKRSRGECESGCGEWRVGSGEKGEVSE